MTTADVAVILGCARRTVAVWANRRWIPGLHRRGRGQDTQWLFTQQHVMRFLENPEHWHLWEPEVIPEARLRAWALKLRGDVRYLTYDEAGQRLGCSRWTIRHYVRSGRLKAYRRSYSLVREADVLALARPQSQRAA
jgi:excisionase family DNA binding protein